MSAAQRKTDTGSFREDAGKPYTPNYWTSKLHEANKSLGNTEQKIYSPHVMLHSPRIQEFRTRSKPLLFNEKPARGVAGFSWEPSRLNVLAAEPNLDNSAKLEYEYNTKIMQKNAKSLEENDRRLFYQKIFIENSKRLQNDKAAFGNESKNLDETKYDKQAKALTQEEPPQTYYDFEINDDPSLNHTRRNLNFFSSQHESMSRISKNIQFENPQERSIALNLTEKSLKASMLNISYCLHFRSGVESEKRSKQRDNLLIQSIILQILSFFLQLGCLSLFWLETRFLLYVKQQHSVTLYIARALGLIIMRLMFVGEITQVLSLLKHCIWYRNLVEKFPLGVLLCLSKLVFISACIIIGTFALMKFETAALIFLGTLLLFSLLQVDFLFGRHFLQKKKPKLRQEFGLYNPEEELLMIGAPTEDAGSRKLFKLIFTIAIDLFICSVFILDIFEIRLYV